MTTALRSNDARCRPSKPCQWRDKCARFVTPLPATGGCIEDFTIYWVHLFLDCQAFVEYVKPAAPVEPARPVRPYMKGL